MQPDWSAEVHRELVAGGVRVVGYVPDAGHKRLIELCQADRSMRAVPLTTEEEGIGLAAGAWLGGEKTVLLMQSSGVGNLVNALGMAQVCRVVLVVTGDGEMLMGLGSFATIGVQQPANLAVVVIDNERYGETGMQRTHTAWGIDLAAVASGCKFKHAITATADVGAVRELVYRT